MLSCCASWKCEISFLVNTVYKIYLISLEAVETMWSDLSAGEAQNTATSPSSNNHDVEKVEASSKASKIARHHNQSTESFLRSSGEALPLKRYVEGSDNLVAAPVVQGTENRRSKRNITSESTKEEEKREMMRRAKSPSARIKEKSRAAKTPRLHSPPPEDEGFEYFRPSGTGPSESSLVLSDNEDDMDMTVSSEVGSVSVW